MKRYSENMHQIYRRTSTKSQTKFIEIGFKHGCSPVNLLHIFRTPFLRNNSGWLLLSHTKNDYRLSDPKATPETC